MGDESLEEMGPIDYVVLEWDGDQPVTGEIVEDAGFHDGVVVAVVERAACRQEIDVFHAVLVPHARIHRAGENRAHAAAIVANGGLARVELGSGGFS